MSNKSSFSDQYIIDCLKTHYHLEVVKLTLLPLGADMNASVYQADTSDQLSYFVKLKYGYHPHIPMAILELLYDAGIQQIIMPLKTKQSQSVQSINDFTLIVYPFIKGQNGFNRALMDNQWLILGKILRQVHEIKVPLSIQRQLRRESYSPNYREIVRSLDILMETKQRENEIALRLLSFISKNAVAIHRLADRAEQLAQSLQNDTSQFVLCHSDIHAGNILIDENDAIYIVDWDEPIMAPKERDLMFIGGGVGNVWNKPHEVAIFYEGYGKTDVNTTILAYYRHERIIEDIALFTQQLFSTTSDGINRLEIYKHFTNMFEPNGVVEIAFKTDTR